MLKLIAVNPKVDYEDFYTANRDRVFRYVHNKIANYEDSEDLVSEVFLYCYSHYDDYDPEKSSLSTWLYLIVNSRLKNYYRDHVSNVDFDSVSGFLEDNRLDLDAAVYLEQLHDALMKSIKQLPERQRAIVMMRYFQNCSSEEMAARLGISEGNVRVLLSRALKKLSQSKDEYWKEFINHG